MLTNFFPKIINTSNPFFQNFPFINIQDQSCSEHQISLKLHLNCGTNQLTYPKSSIGSSPSPSIPISSRVPRMWLRSTGPLILFGVLPGWTGVFSPLFLPLPKVVLWTVASATTRMALSTAKTGATEIFLWAPPRRRRSQLSLMLLCIGPITWIGEVLTEYIPGWGYSIAWNNRRRMWHVNRALASTSFIIVSLR